jgi:hypothetical protein
MLVRAIVVVACALVVTEAVKADSIEWVSGYLHFLNESNVRQPG